MRGARVDIVDRDPAVEGVRVEERTTVPTDARGHDVVHGAFHRVGEPLFAGSEEQPPREHDRRDACTGLGVGAVRRELVVVAEGLVHEAGAHPAGQVGPSSQGGVPLAHDGREEVVVPRIDGDVHRRRRQVQRSYGVTPEYGRFPDRHVVLEVRRPEQRRGQQAAPAPLDERRRRLAVSVDARCSGELGQRRLDLGVTTDLLRTTRPEHAADVVRDPICGTHERVLARRPKPGDRRLDQVTSAVQLVPPRKVGVTLRLPCSPEPRVEVPIRLLRRDDARGQRLVEPLGRLPGLRVRRASHIPGARLYDLVGLRVGELPARPLAALPAAARSKFASQPSSSSHEVQCSSVLALFTARRSAQKPPVISTAPTPIGASRPPTGATGTASRARTIAMLLSETLESAFACFGYSRLMLRPSQEPSPRGASMSSPGSGSRRVTLADVAAFAGVSLATASKALNGRGDVRDATRERVRVAAERLGFEFNTLAQGLSAGRSGTVGMLTSDLVGRFSSPSSWVQRMRSGPANCPSSSVTLAGTRSASNTTSGRCSGGRSTASSSWATARTLDRRYRSMRRSQSCTRTRLDVG